VKCDAEHLDYIYRAAALLTPPERDAFVRAVASQLCGERAPTAKEVSRAVRFVLEVRHGIAIGRRVLG
jgi:hypothetical protein